MSTRIGSQSDSSPSSETRPWIAGSVQGAMLEGFSLRSTKFRRARRSSTSNAPALVFAESSNSGPAEHTGQSQVANRAHREAPALTHQLEEQELATPAGALASAAAQAHLYRLPAHVGRLGRHRARRVDGWHRVQRRVLPQSNISSLTVPLRPAAAPRRSEDTERAPRAYPGPSSKQPEQVHDAIGAWISLPGSSDASSLITSSPESTG